VVAHEPEALAAGAEPDLGVEDPVALVPDLVQPAQAVAGLGGQSAVAAVRAPGSPNPPQDVTDPVTGGWLLDHGFALAGSSDASTGWAIKDALAGQAAVLDAFEVTVGHPRQTIAWATRWAAWSPPGWSSASACPC
jgi:hypothetical protein